MINKDQIVNVGDLLRKSAPSSPLLINGFLKGEGTLSRLLKSSNAKNVRISNEAREFSSDAPFYIDRIEFHSDDPSRILLTLEVHAVGVDGKLRKTAGRAVNVSIGGVSTRVIRYDVRSVCKSIQVRADVIFKSLVATTTKVYGYSYSQFEAAGTKLRETIALLEDIDSYSEKVNHAAQQAEERESEAKESASSIEEHIQNLEEKTEELSTKRSALELEISEATKRKSETEISIKSAIDRLTSSQNSESQLKRELESLNKRIVDGNQELAKLANDRSLISDEFKDYVSEGKKQSRSYEWFLYLCIVIIAACSFQLFTGAKTILEADLRSYSEVFALVIQRLPFAMALTAVIGVCWKLSEMFVKRIMIIHSQRLGLARLLVVAKDTVFSSMEGLNIPDESKFRERIRVKFQMLKSHLTSELGRDFEYDTGSAEPYKAENSEDDSEGENSSAEDDSDGSSR